MNRKEVDDHICMNKDLQNILNSVQNDINIILRNFKRTNISSLNLLETNVPFQFGMMNLKSFNKGILIKDILLYHFLKFTGLMIKYKLDILFERIVEGMFVLELDDVKMLTSEDFIKRTNDEIKKKKKDLFIISNNNNNNNKYNFNERK